MGDDRMTETASVKLAHPFNIDGQLISEVTIRRPKVRDLRSLEKAGLISVERRGRRSPVVTLLVANDIEPTDKR